MARGIDGRLAGSGNRWVVTLGAPLRSQVQTSASGGLGGPVLLILRAPKPGSGIRIKTEEEEEEGTGHPHRVCVWLGGKTAQRCAGQWSYDDLWREGQGEDPLEGRGEGSEGSGSVYFVGAPDRPKRSFQGGRLR